MPDLSNHHTIAINQPLQHTLERLLADLQLDDAPAGGAVVVYQAGRCIAQASVGMAQAGVPWQTDTLSLNFSTGKGVLATLIHVLVSERLLDYDTPIANYWPAFGANGKAEITLRAVMSHQADLFAITSIDASNETLLDWEQMLAQVADMTITKPYLAAEKTVEYVSAYSALIYGWVLGGVIEAATQMPLANALRHYLTEPLGISESCYFGVPAEKVTSVAQLVKDFYAKDFDAMGEAQNSAGADLRRRRHKPTLKVDSPQTLATYATLPSYPCWKKLALERKLVPNDARLTGMQINRLYFDHSALNLRNYKAALMPASNQPIDYYDSDTMQAAIPAANGVASAHALAVIYAMLANGGVWKDKVFIDSATFTQLSMPQVSGLDAVMPTNMNWRLGYHRLLQLCENQREDNQGFGHMGYNGSVAWCDPSRKLSFAFVHNFDVTMLGDIRQFALTEAVLSAVLHHE